MPKVISLKSTEEITSIIERLWETGAREVYFITPKNSEFLKNIVALKLLKREADRLDKVVILVTKDDVGREMAKRVGLTARVILPKGVEEINLPDDESKQDQVLKDLPSQKYESLIEEEVMMRREKVTQAPASEVVDIKQAEPHFFEEYHSEKITEAPIEEAKESEKTEPSFFASLRRGREESPGPYFNKPAETLKSSASKIGWRKKDLPLDGDDTLEDSIKKPSSIFSSFKFFIFFIGAAFLIAGAVLYFILPKADIVIGPKTEVFTEDLQISADKSINKIDEAAAKIPAQLIKLDKKLSKDFPVSGQRQVNDKAKGVITIYNEFSSSPQALVEKTRFISESGKVFRITKTVTVPGAQIQEGKISASSIDAEVVADEAGEQYNIGPGKFTIPGFQGTPKYAAFYGRSKDAMSGGAVGLFRVVSQEDFDKAKNQVWQDLQSLIDRGIREQVPEGLKLLDEAIKEEMILVESSVAVGERAENFNLSIKGTATVLIFDEKNIFDLAAKKAVADLSENMALDSAAGQIDYREVKADFTKGQLSFKAKVTGRAVSEINIDSLKRLVAGKDESQIKQLFGQKQEIEKARILFWPFWVKSVPGNLDKINIKISVDQPAD